MRPTSLSAYYSVKDGKRSMQKQILDALRMHPMTTDHLELILRMKHQTASARVKELADSGYIKDSGTKEKTRSGRPAIVWEVV